MPASKMLMLDCSLTPKMAERRPRAMPGRTPTALARVVVVVEP
jgi:hypothetical protein